MSILFIHSIRVLRFTRTSMKWMVPVCAWFGTLITPVSDGPIKANKRSKELKFKLGPANMSPLLARGMEHMPLLFIATHLPRMLPSSLLLLHCIFFLLPLPLSLPPPPSPSSFFLTRFPSSPLLLLRSTNAYQCVDTQYIDIDQCISVKLWVWYMK